jgi:hypothetical protein
VSAHRLDLGDIALTRVGYVDVPIPPDAAGLTAADFADVPWREPLWTEGEQLRAGAAAWFADAGGKRLVFDPVQAADDVLRADAETEQAQQHAVAELFEQAGFERESVDLLVLSHIEGIGMVAWRHEDGSWGPFFPNARVLVSDPALAELRDWTPDDPSDATFAAWHALLDQGRVATFGDGAEIVPGVRAEVTGGHCPGHSVFHFGAGDDVAATMLGHLAISPVHLATGECPPQHEDAASAWSTLRALADDGRMLVGPLWPAPGSGRWLDGAFVASD